MKKLLNNLLNIFNLELRRFPNNTLSNRLQLITSNKIDVVLDIGANTGQYASLLRKLGYKNRIISFEPLSNAYKELERKAAGHKTWESRPYGASDINGDRILNIANNSESSSIEEMLPAHLINAPTSKYVGQETIQVKTLEDIIEEERIGHQSIMLKLDIQGHEYKVLKSAVNILKKLRIIQIEMSLNPLYKDELSYIEMTQFLETNGFVLKSIEPGFYNQVTGELLQFDGIFVRV